MTDSGRGQTGGNMGTDSLDGGPGDDLLRGGQDEDTLSGSTGNDTLYGDLEGDFQHGGAGDDVIILGNDPNVGDGAVDTVVLLTSDGFGIPFLRGVDTIYGFEAHDQVVIDGVLSTPAEAEALGLAVFHFV